MPMDVGHPDPQLVEMFRGMRQDARSDPKPAELAESFVVVLGFDGAGLLPQVGGVQILDLGQIVARVTGATIVANGVGSAVIDLRHGTFADVPTLAQMYGVSGGIPTLASAASVVLDTTGWTVNLQPADVLLATLMSVSGAFTCVSISLHCRRLKWPAGSSILTDSGTNTLTTASGNIVTLRG